MAGRAFGHVARFAVVSPVAEEAAVVGKLKLQVNFRAVEALPASTVARRLCLFVTLMAGLLLVAQVAACVFHSGPGKGFPAVRFAPFSVVGPGFCGFSYGLVTLGAVVFTLVTVHAHFLAEDYVLHNLFGFGYFAVAGIARQASIGMHTVGRHYILEASQVLSRDYRLAILLWFSLKIFRECPFFFEVMAHFARFDIRKTRQVLALGAFVTFITLGA
jgi:hypothetical protein